MPKNILNLEILKGHVIVPGEEKTKPDVNNYSRFFFTSLKKQSLFFFRRLLLNMTSLFPIDSVLSKILIVGSSTFVRQSKGQTSQWVFNGERKKERKKERERRQGACERGREHRECSLEGVMCRQLAHSISLVN